MNAPIIIIPAYQPTEILIHIVKELRSAAPKQNILIINDGSGPEYASIFSQLEPFDVLLLQHEKNMGKGAALKTAFKYCLNAEFYFESSGVITADADGQHSVADILKMSAQLMSAPDKLHIGCRQFSTKDIPWRSRFGNHLTRWICNKILNINISDTQSGLRAIPQKLVALMLAAKTQRYEFELEMLLVAKKNKVTISSIPIQTIYINQNRASHFNPIIDSVKIYFVFVRFAFISMMSGLIDILIFFCMFYTTQQLFLSIIVGRVLSGTFNFSMNKNYTFKNADKIMPVFLKYITLSSLLILSSYTLIKIIYAVGYSIYFSKIFAELSLYILSFILQRTVVFKKNEIAVNVEG